MEESPEAVLGLHKRRTEVPSLAVPASRGWGWTNCRFDLQLQKPWEGRGTRAGAEEFRRQRLLSNGTW